MICGVGCPMHPFEIKSIASTWQTRVNGVNLFSDNDSCCEKMAEDLGYAAIIEQAGGKWLLIPV